MALLTSATDEKLFTGLLCLSGLMMRSLSFTCLPGRMPTTAAFAMADYRKKNALADDLNGRPALAPETGASNTAFDKRTVIF